MKNKIVLKHLKEMQVDAETLKIEDYIRRNDVKSSEYLSRTEAQLTETGRKMIYNHTVCRLKF